MGGGTAYVASREKDPFLKLFSMGVVNQESCFTCPFRNETSADIRLGDYWGERFKNNEDGVSMVLINGSRGLALLKKINQVLVIFLSEILRTNQYVLKLFFIQIFEKHSDIAIHTTCSLRHM